MFILIQVFNNDGMPATICDYCVSMVSFCYDFRAMCKEADNILRHFPETGIWPTTALIMPQFPVDLAMVLHAVKYSLRHLWS